MARARAIAGAGIPVIREGRGARFVERSAELLDDMTAGVTAIAQDVRTKRYPALRLALEALPRTCGSLTSPR